ANINATLQLDNSTPLTTPGNRLAGANITINSGTFAMIGASNATSNETLGLVTIAGATSTIYTQAGSGQNLSLTAASLVRNAGATVNFEAAPGQVLGSTSNKVVFTNADPKGANSIIKGATVTDATSSTTGVNNTTGLNLATTTGSGPYSV